MSPTQSELLRGKGKQLFGRKMGDVFAQPFVKELLVDAPGFKDAAPMPPELRRRAAVVSQGPALTTQSCNRDPERPGASLNDILMHVCLRRGALIWSPFRRFSRVSPSSPSAWSRARSVA